MAEINLQKRAVYAGDVHIALLKAGWSIREACDFVNGLPKADVAEVRQGRWIRLIDAGAFERHLMSAVPEDNVCDDCLQCVIDELISYPAVDAVEVVRCKDCIHMTIEQGLRYCNAWERFNGAGDEGYCNYGEKRESGTQPQREDV